MKQTVQEVRARAYEAGPRALNAIEILTLIVGDEDLAVALWESSSKQWRKLPDVSQAALPPAARARWMAALELGQRIREEPAIIKAKIRDAADVVRLMKPKLADLPHEEFHLLSLDSQAQVIRDSLITKGLLNSSLVHPREVFRAAIQEAAAGIIVVHNHPSGDPTPSAEDRAVTRQLVEAGRLLDVPVYDHVIIAGDRWTSFANEGML